MDNRTLLMGAALGAGLTYVFDPQSGRRRRAMVGDKLVRAGHVTRDAVDTTSRDLVNRGRGLAAATRARLSSAPMSDEVLRERVRARLGRTCSHPHAIDVLVNDGHVTLRGPVLADEVSGILAMVDSVPGVRSWASELDQRESAENVPALQGEGRRIAGRDALPRNWSPATRAVVTTLGVAAAGMLYRGYARHAA